MGLDVFYSFNAVAAVLIILIVYFVKKVLSRNANLPPGPVGYPIIGSMPLVVKDPMYIAFRKLRQQYGDIFSLTMGQKLVVVINGYHNLREAFVKNGDVFSDRPDLFTFQYLLKEKGVISSSGHFWKDTRTFALNTLRGFGFGKRSLESQIVEEVEALLQIIDDQQGKPYDLKPTLKRCASNVICNMVFGRRFEHGDKESMTVVHHSDEFARLNILGGPLNFFPFLRHIPGDILGKQAQNRLFRQIFGFIDENIAYHKNTLDKNSPRDFIDAFLIDQEKNSHKEIMQDDNLRASISNFFIAGTQPIVNTVYWAVLFLLYNKDKQDMLRQEIEKVVGSSRLPSLKDKNSLPYFEAFITETMRLGNVTPLSVPHGLKQDVNFKGYTLPKGTVVFAALDSVMNDPEFFKDPTKFDPTRFLDENGKVCNTERMVGFSLGRRVCMGESLARMELFLFLTSLVQRYRIEPEDENDLPTTETIHLFLREAQTFRCRLLKID